IDITVEQAAALQTALDSRSDAGSFAVVVGMLHSPPRIDTAVDSLLAAGATRVIAFVLAPQYSPIIMAGYERAVAVQREAHPALDRKSVVQGKRDRHGGRRGREEKMDS